MRIFASRNLLVILISAALLFIGLTAANAPAQEPAAQQRDGWSALKTGDGVLFIWNRTGLSFTISIKGNEVRPMDAGENIFFMVDGLVLQIQSLPITDFAADARKNKLSDEAILGAHRDWEVGFIENELLHKKISVKSSAEKLPNGMQALVWQYDLPEGFRNPDAHTQMYVTVVAKDYLILLNSVAKSTSAEPAIQNFLRANMSTLKISAERIDVEKEQEKLRKSQP
jgi:hypothetical protein